jgi:hypothetical protein
MALWTQTFLLLGLAFLWGMLPVYWIQFKAFAPHKKDLLDGAKGLLFFAVLRVLQSFYFNEIPLFQMTDLNLESFGWVVLFFVLAGNFVNRRLNGNNQKGYWIFGGALALLSPFAFLFLVAMTFVFKRGGLKAEKMRLAALFFSLIAHLTVRPANSHLWLVFAVYFFILCAHEEDLDEILKNAENY